MKLVIALDHAGFSLKQKMKKYLINNGYEIKDFGTHSEESIDYPEFGHSVAEVIEKREFGFFLFEKNLVIRHKSFIKIDDLRSFFQKIVPAHAYYSTAYYENPEKEMQKKDWIGADLFFDIDADHIPTE